MHFLLIEAYPKPDSVDYGVADGAWAACWIATDDAPVAESKARALLEEIGWDVELIDECYPVERERYLNSADSLQQFDEAVVNGACVTLHYWKPGAPDE